MCQSTFLALFWLGLAVISLFNQDGEMSLGFVTMILCSNTWLVATYLEKRIR